MALIKPFRAIRPRPDLVDRIAALPYDVMDSDEARTMVEGNPYSFLHIDRAEINFEPPVNPYEPKVYVKARQRIQKMLGDGTLIQDRRECLYIYQQVMDGRKQTGLVCCTSIDDYQNDIIKKHEYTRPEKERDRIDHIDVTDTHTGPIFQTFKANDPIEQTMYSWIGEHSPVYDFASEDGVRHMVWVVEDPQMISYFVASFARVKNLYIADGHHRSAAAFKVGLARREENPGFFGDEEFNFFLSVLFPAPELQIFPYNRVVEDLAGMSPEQFLRRISEQFSVSKACEQPFQPEERHVFGLYLDGAWYKLVPNPGSFPAKDPVKSLDTAILQDLLLKPILKIQDPRIDKRIDFVGGIRGLEELERRVQQGMAAAFSLYPPSMLDVMAVADANDVMPPKSTWFEPKLRSGIFLHSLI